ncbi:MAG: HD domain-containing protein [Dehalococcoidia bacterium]|nr:HD domain-containing protein [Dehalococcoidia bacterium]
MITKELLIRLFDSAYMQRWNDQIRPVELTELDKQAHKMIVAYVLGKYEEENSQFDWQAMIEGGLFEYLQRLVLTDLKPQVFYKIKEDPERYRQLNEWVFSELADVLRPLGDDFCSRFRRYFQQTEEPSHCRVLNGAHLFATKWEFEIIRRANPDGYDIQRISDRLEAQQQQYYELRGLRELGLYPRLRSFVDLCGLLRFQVRWSHVHRIPRTSVLGHMLIVAMLTYLFSLEMGACPRRCVNNYFTGLFHDLPEALTRDIISPVKHSVEGLSALIKTYEKEQMEEKVYPLVPAAWHADLRLFTEDEFRSVAYVDGKVVHLSSGEITERFNEDRFNPRDGEMTKAVDELAAYMEAYLALRNGISSPELKRACKSIRANYSDKTIAGIDFSSVYASL